MIYQSRWGYHPCNFEMYRKLRRIHKAYWEGRRLLAKLQRWQAKLPKHRTRPEPIVPADDVDRFVAITIAELKQLHEGNIARYQLRLSEFAAWKKTLDQRAR